MTLNHEFAHLDLFSGIGGFSLAAESAGFRTIAFSEVDPYAISILRKHWPDCPNLGDITKHPSWPELGHIDILTGGFPCQPFSVAGDQLGQADDRHLWPSMLDVIKTRRPTWVLGENVPGIVGMELSNIIDDLEGCGYAAQPFNVPACAIGTDHERKRIWIIANLNSVRKSQSKRHEQEQWGRTRNGARQTAADIDREGLQSAGKYQAPARAPKGFSLKSAPSCFPGRESYPGLLRKIHGLPRRMDRIRCLGNSIVPQVAEVFLKAIYKELVNSETKP